MSDDRQRQSGAALRKSEKFAAAGRMAASISHEINNPLEAVSTSIKVRMSPGRDW
jgi:C4-dicarboxylate-specific signal transduction histidine kinase